MSHRELEKLDHSWLVKASHCEQAQRCGQDMERLGTISLCFSYSKEAEWLIGNAPGGYTVTSHETGVSAVPD